MPATLTTVTHTLVATSQVLTGGSDNKESACNAGDQGSGLGNIWSGEGNGNPLQYSCLENPMDRGAGQATVRGVTKSQKRLRDERFHSSLSLSQVLKEL